TLVQLEVNLPYYQFPTYTWKSNGIIIPGLSTKMVTTSATGNITCEVSDTSYCPSLAISNGVGVYHNMNPQLKIEVSSFPLNVGQVIDDCSSGANELFEAVDPFGLPYTDPGLQSLTWWSSEPYFPHTTSAISVFESGEYSLNYTSACGTGSDSKIIYFTGYSATRPSIAGTSYACTQASFSVQPAGFYWPGYQWYRNNVLIPGATGSGYIATQGGDYFCVVNNACDTLASMPFHVDLQIESYQIAPVNGTALCNGTGKVLQALGGSTFQWKKNANIISGATSPTYTATSTGKYTCIISGSCGVVYSDTIKITNGTALIPPGSGIQGPDTICPPLASAHYSVSAVNGADSCYWIVPSGATLLTPADSIEIDVAFSKNFYGGQLYFVGVNDCGADTLCILNMVSLRPPKPVWISSPAYGLCNTTKSYKIVSSQVASGYTWIIPTGATLLYGQGTDSIRVQFGTGFTTGTISVFATAGCMNSDTLSIAVTNLPAVSGSIYGPSTACANQTGVSFSTGVVAGAVYYQWTLPPGAIQTSLGNSNTI
ncbi:MAG TPA: hypothetical protein PLP34_09115, partial [Chitinophagaceae bacterium]|nr:hypothetical protein [Chitinophagaceae bacterium]